MLPTSRRVNNQLFKKIFKEGKRFSGQFLYLKVISISADEPSKFSIVVPKSVLSKAVQRNKLKRRGNEVLQTQLPEIQPGSAGVFFFTQKAINASFDEIREDMRTILTNANLL